MGFKNGYGIFPFYPMGKNFGRDSWFPVLCAILIPSLFDICMFHCVSMSTGIYACFFIVSFFSTVLSLKIFLVLCTV